MKKQIEQVKEFHIKFKVPVLESPCIPSDRVKLRHDILMEEVLELQEASYNNDIIKVADGITDCLYILFGTAHEFGIADKLTECFNEVHRSNMSKLDENGNPIFRKDGKVIKSNLYSPPNLEKIILNRNLEAERKVLES